MSLESVIGDLTGLASVLPVSLSDLVFALKALGVIAVVYVVYLIVMAIFTYRRMQKIAHIDEKTDVMVKKIGVLERNLCEVNKSLSKLVKRK